MHRPINIKKKSIFDLSFPTKVLQEFLFYPIRATRSAHLIILNEMNLIIFWV